MSGRPPGILVVLPALPRQLNHALHRRLPTFHKINFHGINTHPLLLRYPNHAGLTPTPLSKSSIGMRRINIIKPTQISRSSFLSTLTLGATHSIDRLISQYVHFHSLQRHVHGINISFVLERTTYRSFSKWVFLSSVYGVCMAIAPKSLTAEIVAFFLIVITLYTSNIHHIISIYGAFLMHLI